MHVHDGADDTWPTGGRIAELESFAVLAHERGRGVGTLLLDAVDGHLADLGILDMIVAVLVGNTAAEELVPAPGTRARDDEDDPPRRPRAGPVGPCSPSRRGEPASPPARRV